MRTLTQSVQGGGGPCVTVTVTQSVQGGGGPCVTAVRTQSVQGGGGPCLTAVRTQSVQGGGGPWVMCAPPGAGAIRRCVPRSVSAPWAIFHARANVKRKAIATN